MIDMDLVSVTEAMKIMKLSQSQVLVLCNHGRLDAKKVGKTWIISRESAENYKPAPRGFAVVWERRRAKEVALNDEIKSALEQAAKHKQEK